MDGGLRQRVRMCSGDDGFMAGLVVYGTETPMAKIPFAGTRATASACYVLVRRVSARARRRRRGSALLGDCRDGTGIGIFTSGGNDEFVLLSDSATTDENDQA
jgi:hypothetical protein